MQLLLVDYVFPFQVRQEVSQVFDYLLSLRGVLDVLILVVDVLRRWDFENFRGYLLSLNVLSDVIDYDFFVVNPPCIRVRCLTIRLHLSRRLLTLN